MRGGPRFAAASRPGSGWGSEASLRFGSRVLAIVPWDALLRRWLLSRSGEAGLQVALTRLGAVSLSALLPTLVLLFGFQGQQIVEHPLVIGLIAVPILIQVHFTSGLAYLLNRLLGVAHCVAGPSALIGARNFFELAVATAVGLFGVHSGAALATVVGVLIEVPMMLSVVRIVNRTEDWYERDGEGSRGQS